MEIKEIIERNYNATVKRGQINNKMCSIDFIIKLEEEFTELKMSIGQSQINPFDITELADIALVCHSMAKHYGYDLVKEMEKKTLYNEIRE